MRKHQKKAYPLRRTALEHIRDLFAQAARFPEWADRYVGIARKTQMRYKVKMPSEFKRRYCRHCGKYLVPGRNCRVRLSGSKLVYYCLECKRFWRMPYIRERRRMRSERLKRQN